MAALAWKQVIRTDSYLDHPVWRLFSSREGDLLCKKLLQGIRARAYAHLGVSMVMEVVEANGRLVLHRVHSQPPTLAQPPAQRSHPLRDCLLGAAGTSDGTEVLEDGTEEEGNVETLHKYASLLLRRLLREARMFAHEPGKREESVARAFEAMLSQKEVPVEIKTVAGLTPVDIDCWMLAQVAVLYTNLGAAAVLDVSAVGLNMLTLLK